VGLLQVVGSWVGFHLKGVVGRVDALNFTIITSIVTYMGFSIAIFLNLREL